MSTEESRPLEVVVRRTVRNTPDERTAPCVDDLAMAAFVEGRLPDIERQAIQEHLVNCSQCREQFADVVSMLSDMPGVIQSPIEVSPRGSRSSFLRNSVIAAGVAAAVLFVIVRGPHTDSNATSTLRDEDGSMRPAPVVVQPTTIASDSTKFVWSRVNDADRYRVTVFSVDGVVMWEAETADTAIVLPAPAPFSAGTSYMWKVSARTEFDRWVSSGLTEFRYVERQ